MNLLHFRRSAAFPEKPMPRHLFVVVLLVVAGAVLGCSGCSRSADAPVPAGKASVKVAVFQIVEHPAIDELRTGFQDAVRSSPALTGKTVVFDYKNAQGDASQISLIADKLVADNPDVIYVMGTPCAQAVAKRTKSVPIILGGATDPVSAGLVKEWDRPGGNVTGTSDLPPVDRQFRLAHEVMPSARRIGVLFNPGEANSVATMKRVRVAARAVSVSLVERPITGSADVAQSARSLIGRCDALYLPTDNTVQSALDAVMNVANENGLPVFNCSLDTVKKGALFSLSVDYRKLGDLSGRMAAQVLTGTAPAELPVKLIDVPELAVNLTTADKLKIQLPGSVMRQVAIQVRNGQVVKR